MSDTNEQPEVPGQGEQAQQPVQPAQLEPQPEQAQVPGQPQTDPVPVPEQPQPQAQQVQAAQPEPQAQQPAQAQAGAMPEQAYAAPAQAAPAQQQYAPPQATQQPPAQYAQAQYTQAQYVQVQTAPKPTRGRGLGIAAMILGIIGAICSFIPFVNIMSFPLVLAGLVLGIVSLVMARGGQGPKGFGIAGIVCSSVALIITIIVMVVTLAATALFGIAATEYIDENYESYAPSYESAADIKIKSIVWDEASSGDLFVYLTVTLENTSSETIDFVQVEIPLYDESGTEVESAYGYASSVEPGTFTVEAIAIKTEDQTLSFREDEVTVSTI